MMKFECHSCKHVLGAKESQIGTYQKCPNCNESLCIPKPVAGNNDDAIEKDSQTEINGKGKNGVIAFSLCIAFAVSLTSYLAYKNHMMTQTHHNETTSLSQTYAETSIDPSTCIFKDVLSLSEAERAVVLQSARSKVNGLIEKKSSWVILYCSPMSLTEVEVLGDFIHDRQLANYEWLPTFKMPVYWSQRVAETSIANNNNADSQFYNSYSEPGKRATGPNPLSFNDESLYASYYPDLAYYTRTFSKIIDYDIDNQILHLQVSAETMIELIFNTFVALQDERRESPFDRLPQLKAVRITYTNPQSQEIGGATYDFRYWAAMRKINSVPEHIRNEDFDRTDALHRDHKAKLISESEYIKKLEVHRKIMEVLFTESYQQKWRELIYLIKDFELNRELPLRGEKPFF